MCVWTCVNVYVCRHKCMCECVCVCVCVCVEQNWTVCCWQSTIAEFALEVMLPYSSHWEDSVTRYCLFHPPTPTPFFVRRTNHQLVPLFSAFCGASYSCKEGMVAGVSPHTHYLGVRPFIHAAPIHRHGTTRVHSIGARCFRGEQQE